MSNLQRYLQNWVLSGHMPSRDSALKSAWALLYPLSIEVFGATSLAQDMAQEILMDSFFIEDESSNRKPPIMAPYGHTNPQEHHIWYFKKALLLRYRRFHTSLRRKESIDVNVMMGDWVCSCRREQHGPNCQRYSGVIKNFFDEKEGWWSVLDMKSHNRFSFLATVRGFRSEHPTRNEIRSGLSWRSSSYDERERWYRMYKDKSIEAVSEAIDRQLDGQLSIVPIGAHKRTSTQNYVPPHWAFWDTKGVCVLLPRDPGDHTFGDLRDVPIWSKPRPIWSAFRIPFPSFFNVFKHQQADEENKSLGAVFSSDLIQVPFFKWRIAFHRPILS